MKKPLDRILDRILVRLGLVTSPSILFDLAMLGENSPYYKRYYKKYLKRDKRRNLWTNNNF